MVKTRSKRKAVEASGGVDEGRSVKNARVTSSVVRTVKTGASRGGARIRRGLRKKCPAVVSNGEFAGPASETGKTAGIRQSKRRRGGGGGKCGGSGESVPAASVYSSGDKSCDEEVSSAGESGGGASVSSSGGVADTSPEDSDASTERSISPVLVDGGSDVEAAANNISPLSNTAGDNGQESGDSSNESSSSSSEEEHTDEQPFPKRVFQTDRYPTNGRVNSYSKLQYLADILAILDGTPQYQTLLDSCFGCLFKLPVRRCLLSGKLVHNFICRQVLSKNSDELWFTFGGYPIRFSLREFELVTGLPCGPYPVGGDIFARPNEREGRSAYWDQLLGPRNDVTIKEIVEMLQAEPGMDPMRKLRLVLIVIVDGILICGTQPIRPSLAIVDMVKDLDLFFSYPWGRLSFERTIRMIKVGEKLTWVSELTKKLRQKSIVVHGFPIAIQLLLFRSVPLLLQHLPYADDEQTFLDRQVTKLPMMKTFHTENILQVENDPMLSVAFILPVVTEEHQERVPVGLESDPKIQNLLTLIQGGYRFTKSDWRGGDASLAQMCICKKRKNLRCKCGAAMASQSTTTADVSTRLLTNDEAAIQIAKLTKQVERLRRCNGTEMKKFKEELMREMRSLVGGREAAGPSLSTRLDDGGQQTSKTRSPSPVADMRPRIPGLNIGGDGSPNVPNSGNIIEEVNHTSSVTQTESALPPEPSTLVGDQLVSGYHSSSSMQCRSERHSSASNLPAPTDTHLHSTGKVDVVIGGTEPDVALKTIASVGAENVGNVHADCNSMDEEVANIEGCSPVDSSVPDLHLHPDNVCDPPLRVDYILVEPCPVPIDDAAPLRPSHLCDASPVQRSTRLKLPTAKVKSTTSRDGTEEKNLSSPKVPFVAFPVVRDRLVDKFKAKLEMYPKKCYELDGCEVSKTFFSEIYTPQMWVFRTHMDFMIRAIWKKQGSFLVRKGIVLLDSLLTQLLVAQYLPFIESAKPADYVWHPLLHTFVAGTFGERSKQTLWFKDVSTVYVPMNWGNKHWVGLVISLKARHIDILDPLVNATSDRKVSSFMAPLVKMLPNLIKATCDAADIGDDADSDFTFVRLQGLAQNTRTGDCGPLSVKFMELHSHGWSVEQLGLIDDAMVNQLRMQYALSVYEEFVGKVK